MKPKKRCHEIAHLLWAYDIVQNQLWHEHPRMLSGGPATIVGMRHGPIFGVDSKCCKFRNIDC